MVFVNTVKGKKPAKTKTPKHLEKSFHRFLWVLSFFQYLGGISKIPLQNFQLYAILITMYYSILKFETSHSLFYQKEMPL